MEPTQSDVTPGEEAGKSDLRNLVDSYLVSKATNGSGAYSTSACSELERWVRWMEARDYDLDDLSDESDGPEVIRRYAQRLGRRSLADDGIAASTANTYYAYIRACLAWGVRDGRLERNPAVTHEATEELPTSSSSRSDQQHWSPEERDRLLDHVQERAHDVPDENGLGPEMTLAARDRALVATLYYPAVRSAEVLRSRHDDREGRQGLRWKNVDLANGRAYILGKGEQQWVWHPLPGPTVEYLARLKDVQRPASDEWPVFATSHSPSLWRAAREQLDQDVDALVEDLGSIHNVLRERDVAPPALTTDGARSRLKSLCHEADIDPENGDYLQPHGARRGMIGEVFKRDRGEAQDLGRHKDMGTTEDAYRHLDVEEQRDRLDNLISETE